jgi:hypothetical protein
LSNSVFKSFFYLFNPRTSKKNPKRSEKSEKIRKIKNNPKNRRFFFDKNPKKSEISKDFFEDLKSVHYTLFRSEQPLAG